MEKGLREIEKGKKYQFDLRSFGGGEPIFRGTRKEAKLERQNRVLRLTGGNYINPGNVPTICGAVAMFLDVQENRVLEKEIGKGELDNKRRHLQQFCAVKLRGKLIGKIPVTDVYFDDLDGEIKKQLHQNRSIETVLGIFGTVRQFFGWCQNKREPFIMKNPAAPLRISKKRNANAKKRGKTRRRISPDDIRQILKFLPDMYRLPIMFAAYTGMRAGEIVALTWEQVHLGNDDASSFVDVDKSKKKDGEIDEPKTEAGFRSIRLIAPLSQELRKWKFEQPLEQRQFNLVFPSSSGSIADAGNWRKRGLHKACDAARIKRISFHNLRNFYASALIFNSDVSDAQTAVFLGHSSIDFTFTHYARYYEDHERDQLLTGSLEKSLGASPEAA